VVGEQKKFSPHTEAKWSVSVAGALDAGENVTVHGPGPGVDTTPNGGCAPMPKSRPQPKAPLGFDADRQRRLRARLESTAGLAAGERTDTLAQMGSPSRDMQTASTLRGGRIVLDYDAINDVVTLSYSNLVLEAPGDVEWFEQQCVGFWRDYHGSPIPSVRKDLLVDMDGIVVKPAVAAAWNAARGRIAEKYLGKTYRFGGERRTQTAIHLGQVLQKTEGMIYADRKEALAALLADRLAARRAT
jgi:hypothetical protein